MKMKTIVAAHLNKKKDHRTLKEKASQNLSKELYKVKVQLTLTFIRLIPLLFSKINSMRNINKQAVKSISQKIVKKTSPTRIPPASKKSEMIIWS